MRYGADALKGQEISAPHSAPLYMGLKSRILSGYPNY
ncbi:hypothetical protein Barb6_03328 [Bacteroidales bacterium Barb6]|nr:hypothetical protein Barb6_03328 [Bacteroidales bacterium Barb6]